MTTNTPHDTDSAVRKITLDDIRALNIEPSARCNAACVFCSRQKKVRPYGRHLLGLQDFKHLPLPFLAGLKRISFGGNFGDLCCNPEMVAISEYIRSNNPDITLEGDTNGSNQSTTWWGALGAFFTKGAMVFALDGLADTHAIHRRGTDFDKIVANIKAFAAGGGIAFWKFIAFEHNEHQIDAAAEMAEDIGCRRFFVISSREYGEAVRKPAATDTPIKRELYEAYRDNLPEEERHATCRPLLNHSLYIAADGTVHPCCLAHCMYIAENDGDFKFIVPLIEKYQHRINFKTTPIDEIVSGPYFAAAMKSSRSNPFCMARCNVDRNRVRRRLVLDDRWFDR